MNVLIFLALLLIGLAIVMSIISDEEKSSTTFKELEDEFQQNGKVYFNICCFLFFYCLDTATKVSRVSVKKCKIGSKCGFFYGKFKYRKKEL